MSPTQNHISAEQKESLHSFLRNLKIFSVFSDDDIYDLIERGRLQNFKKSSSIVVEGENSQGLNVIISGKVSVYKADPESDQLIRLAHLDTGAIFGELSLISKSPRSATVIAESPVDIFDLDDNAFNAFLDAGGPPRQLGFFRNCSIDLADRFREQNEDYLNTQRLLWKKAFTKERTAAS